jgi:hypothetical protein
MYRRGPNLLADMDQGPISAGSSDVFQGERGERRPPTFFTRGTASTLPKSNVGERRSPWQGLNMSEVQ